MSTLIVQLPARPRLPAGGSGAGDAAPEAATHWEWVLADADLLSGTPGSGPIGQMPRAASVVAVVGPWDLSWHRLTLPRAPAAKLRPALLNLLEDALLADAHLVHVAVQPQASPGAAAWVATTDRAWLARQLSALEAAGSAVDRVVPALWPDDERPRAHFLESPDDGDDPDTAMLALAHAGGVVAMPLAGDLARLLVQSLPAPPGRWTAVASVAAPAERWLDGPVEVLSPVDSALLAARSAWNLRQFDLVARKPWRRSLRELGRAWRSPRWRAARLGLAALAGVQLVGLNAWAWTQRQAVERLQAEQLALLRQTYPQVRTVVDAPLQMQREAQALRTQAGRAGPEDFEPMLAAAAAAWPPGQPPIQGLRFEPGRLTLTAPGWGEAELGKFRERLAAAGLALEAAEGRLVLRVAAGPSPQQDSRAR